MSKFRFDKKAQKFRSRKQVLLEKLGNDAVNYFKVEVFDSGSFDGVSWKPRQDGDQSRRLMVKTGRLRNGTRITQRGSNYIRVGNDVPYAVYHNEGTQRLPKRKFIGKAKVLDRRAHILIRQYLREGIV